jgi:hypothetical protein
MVKGPGFAFTLNGLTRAALQTRFMGRKSAHDDFNIRIALLPPRRPRQ